MVDGPAHDEPSPSRSRATLREQIEHAAHLLPAQGPLTVFVHHNTLHAFEGQSFHEGVCSGGQTYGCEPYLAEDEYRRALAAGRIRRADLEAVVEQDLGALGGEHVGGLSSRHDIRLALVCHDVSAGSAQELRWIMAETEALHRFSSDVSPDATEPLLREARRWALEEVAPAGGAMAVNDSLREVLESCDRDRMHRWSTDEWVAFTLHALWALSQDGVRRFMGAAPDDDGVAGLRHRDVLLRATGRNSDELVHEVLIPFCAAFLDQGMAQWGLPDRERGFAASFARLYTTQFMAAPRWRRQLAGAVRGLLEDGETALDSIAESLDILGVTSEEQEAYLTRSLLALRGWAGMAWQMETNAEWCPRPAPAGTLVEFVAVRLVLDRLALTHVARESLGFEGPLRSLRATVAMAGPGRGADATEQTAFVVFRLAQILRWPPGALAARTASEWQALLREIAAFGPLERRRMFQLGFERSYREDALRAIATHVRTRTPAPPLAPPSFQVVCCIDEREESFRRLLEEVEPACETFGVAGFFGVAMYYRGVGDAHFRPLCPVTIRPSRYVAEEAAYSLQQWSLLQQRGRREIGRLSHALHLGSRTLVGGVVAGLGGAVAAVPLVARILFPTATATLRRAFGRLGFPIATQLHLEREVRGGAEPDPQLGYTVDEMVDVVEGTLRAMGLTPAGGFAPLVVICGHGSSSRNNPHEAAHDCGACGGGRGGPNARAFAEMANDRRVRRALGDRGLLIPDAVYFVGAYHNTCDDSVEWYDLDRMPRHQRPLFEHVRQRVDVARTANAQERCRRFESAPLSLQPPAALRHVEERSEDLSQVRPEYGHATNALCLVGRRAWSRGLFCDRRAFLSSYDPTQDDERGTTLEGLLQAVIPVCAGISLEYYFSYVDPRGYGCGTKLPHNISALLGVMDGALSDLRTGLPWQMVEIHEPVRLLFVIETGVAVMRRIIAANEGIARLVEGEWVQLVTFDQERVLFHRYRGGSFEPYEPTEGIVPTAPSSRAWCRGRDHLGFASVVGTEEG